MLDIQSECRGLIAHGVSACAGCGLEIGARYIVNTIGDRSTLVIPPGCAALFSGYSRETVTKIPGFQGNLENTAAYAAGIKAGYEVQGKDVTVMGMAGDGATVDIGLQSLSGALERGDRILYICYDNEAYMNTGIQGSASTPTNAWTTTTPAGKQGYRKDLGRIVAAHRIPYLATASVGFVDDFKKKLLKAKEATRTGPAFIHLHAPCPTGWRSRPDKTVEIARLAVTTRCWPLYEAVDGEVSLTKKVDKPKPLQDYFKLQGRFKSVSDEQAEAMVADINASYERIAEGRL